MLVLANGIPKSGTHYLAACLAIMGFSPAEPIPIPGMRTIYNRNGIFFLRGHWSYKDFIPEYDKHIYIIRNPRNILISRVRYDGDSLCEESIIRKIRIFDSGKSLYDSSEPFFRWLGHPHVLNVKFEQMLTDGGEAIESIAEYVSSSSNDAYTIAPLTKTETRTGELSVWQDHWTEKIEDVWQSCNGTLLEAKLGYEN